MMLAADSLTRRFGDLTAVDHADLAVAPGEVVGLLGANGAGKTTLIRMVLGLLRPSGGEVLLFGQPPDISTRRRIGYVPQSLGLYEDLTIQENMSFVARAFGVASQTDLTSLGGGNRLVRDLPLGLKRRVAFAAAFLHSPELLVLDEPTSGVGPLARTQLWDGIREAATRGTGVLVSTHHMGEAEQCDRVVLMAAGRVVASGSIEQLGSDSKVVEIQSEDWAAVFNALDDAGLSLSLKGRKVRVIDSSLDQVSSLLEAQGIRAELSIEAATFEETFLSMTRAA